MGVLVNLPPLQYTPAIPAPILPGVTKSVSLMPWSAAMSHFHQWSYSISNIPQVCWSGNAVSDFQRTQCQDFWIQLGWSTLFAFLPLGFVLLFLKLGLDSMQIRYKKARKLIEKGSAIAKGVVTQPAVAPNDRFGWFFCLRSISIELPNKSQIVVYMPLDDAIPLPGETLAVFDWGEHFGKKRLIGTLYAPHLAILSGSATE